MNQHRIFFSNFILKLADRLEKRLALDIAHSSPYLDNRNSFFLRVAGTIKPALNLICNMRNHLHSPAAEVTAALLLEYGPVDLSCGHITVAVQALIYKPFIMPQIEIRLRSVVRDEDFAVLNRIHGSGIYINIGIKLLHRHPAAPCL